MTNTQRPSVHSSFIFHHSSFIILLLLAAPASAATWFVDDDAPFDPGPNDPLASDPAESGSAAHPFDAIQEAIDAAAPGDAVSVLDGIYTGPGNYDIDFLGKQITVASAGGPARCTIDAAGTGEYPRRAFHFHSGETPASVITGFTIIGGYASGYSALDWLAGSGGAILCDAASPTIAGNVISACSASYLGGAICCLNASAAVIIGNTITGNAAGAGGGICCWALASPQIGGNRITDNSAEIVGGGIHLDEQSTVAIANCLVARNAASAMNGGGLGCWGKSAASLVNLTIAGNSASMYGGGIDCAGSTISVKNSIVWNNAGSYGANAAVETSAAASSLEVGCTCIGGGRDGICVLPGNQLTWGEGNIAVDPLFADPAARDYHLKSIGGRWK